MNASCVAARMIEAICKLPTKETVDGGSWKLLAQHAEATVEYRRAEFDMKQLPPIQIGVLIEQWDAFCAERGIDVTHYATEITRQQMAMCIGANNLQSREVRESVVLVDFPPANRSIFPIKSSRVVKVRR